MAEVEVHNASPAALEAAAQARKHYLSRTLDRAKLIDRFGKYTITLAASVVMVNFWDLPPGETRDLLQGVFASNVAIVGGLLVVIAQAL